MNQADVSKQDDAPDYEGFFSELEARLANLSHTDEAVRVIESTVSARFKKTAHRQVAFAFPGGICVDPIVYEDAVVAGKIAFDEDHFSVLQGDAVSTETAYFMSAHHRWARCSRFSIQPAILFPVGASMRHYSASAQLWVPATRSNQHCIIY